MPRVKYKGLELLCEEGANLRTVLTEAGATPHNGTSAVVNCRGLGTCGTCAVEIQGDVEEIGLRESLRLSAPPHRMESGLRLSCFVRVTGDITVTKHEGFWGQELLGQPLTQ